MSWHFLQEGVAVSSEADSSDGAPAALLNMLPGRETFFSRAKPTALYPRSPSGMTSVPSMDIPGEVQLMLFQEASPAKTSPQQIRKQKDWPASVRNYFGRCSASLTRFGLDLSLPKTLHYCALADLPLSSKDLPAWGMMQDGAYWVQAMSAPPTRGNECGSWPTPICGRGTNFQRKKTGFMDNPEGHANRDGFLSEEEMNGNHFNGGLNAPFREWLMGWPIGWADAASPLSGTGRSQQWRLLHSRFFPLDSSKEARLRDYCKRVNISVALDV